MYFHRLELAWPGRSRTLRRSRVVVGAGAIGSVLAMRLARAGVGSWCWSTATWWSRTT